MPARRAVHELGDRRDVGVVVDDRRGCPIASSSRARTGAVQERGHVGRVVDHAVVVDHARGADAERAGVGRCGASSRTAAGDARRRSRRASAGRHPALRRRRCRRDRPAPTRRLVPPRSTPNVAVVAHGHSSPRCWRTTRSAASISAFAASSSASAASSTWSFTSGTAPSSSVSHALEDRRRRQRALLGAASLERRPRRGAASRTRRRRVAAARPARRPPTVLHHVVSVVRLDHLVCFDRPLQVPQRGPHDHARRPPLDQPRQRDGEIDPQRVVDVGAVAVGANA